MIEIACNEYFSGPNFLIYFNSVIPSVLSTWCKRGEISIFETTFITRGEKKKEKGKKKRKKEMMGFLLKL